MIGLAHNTVKLVDSCSEWPKLFEAERKRIKHTLGDNVRSIEHIGSTAVPGLAAKPIIDILIGLNSIEVLDAILTPLQNLNYVYRGENGIPNRHYFEKDNDAGRTHHIHAVKVDSTFHKEHLAFRDYLLTNSETAKLYQELKEQLVLRYPADRDAYCDAKSDFIQSLLRLIV